MTSPLRPARALAPALALIAAAAVPAAAQTGQRAEPLLPGPQPAGACGQPAGATFVLAEPIDRLPAEPFRARILRAEPVYLEFSLAAPVRVALRSRESGEADPFLSLFDSAGALLASNDDGGGELDSLLDLTLEPGRYCAQIRIYGAGRPEAGVTLALAAGEAAADLAFVPEPEAPPPACSDPERMSFVGALAPGIGTLELGGTLEPGGVSDWLVELTEAMPFAFSASSEEFDTVITLFDAGGVELARDDDGGEGTDSLITLDAGPGSYCLRVEGYGGGGGAFVAGFSDEPGGSSLPAPEAGVCTDPARTVALGTDAAPGMGRFAAGGRVEPGGFADFRFRASATLRLQIDVSSAEFDTTLDLYDAAGGYIDGNDDSPAGGTDSRITPVLEPGDYCLRVQGFAGAGGAFELALTDEVARTPDEADPCSDPASTADLGRPVAPGFGLLRLPGELAPGARQDWTVTVEGSTELQFDATSGDFDTVLTLHDAYGAPVAGNDDGPEGTDSRFSAVLEPGSYCLSLRSFGGGGTGRYEVALMELDPETLLRMAWERGEMMPPPDSGVEIEDLGVLAGTLRTERLTQERTKWMAFTLGEPGLVQVTATSLMGGFTLRLYDSLGLRLAEETSAGLPRTASIYRELAPGRYMIALTDDGAAAAGRLSLRQAVLARWVRP